MQLENISINLLSSSTPLKFKLGKSIIFKSLHPLNIFSIFVTFDVSKLDKFKEVKLLHSLNKLSIVFTFPVLKLEISIHFNDSHLQNIWPKFIV